MQRHLRASQVANQSTEAAIQLNISQNNQYQNIQYTGPAFLGTPLQGSNSSDFVYDTGSGYLTVTSTGCADCSTKYYNQSASSTASNSTQYNET
jgi:hypothetical protein